MSLMTPAPHRFELIEIPTTAHIGGLPVEDDKTERFVRDIGNGDKFPPVDAERRSASRFRIVNGFHRASAYRKLGLPVPALVAVSVPWSTCKKGYS